MISLGQITPLELDFAGGSGLFFASQILISVSLKVQTGTDVLRNPTIVLIRNSPGFSVTP